MLRSSGVARMCYNLAPWFFLFAGLDAGHFAGIKILLPVVPVAAVAMVYRAKGRGYPGSYYRPLAVGATILAGVMLAWLANSADVTGFVGVGMVCEFGGQAWCRRIGITP
jgi:hypothetical protein